VEVKVSIMVWALYHRRQRPRYQFIRAWVDVLENRQVSFPYQNSSPWSFTQFGTRWVGSRTSEKLHPITRISRSLLPSHVFQKQNYLLSTLGVIHKVSSAPTRLTATWKCALRVVLLWKAMGVRVSLVEILHIKQSLRCSVYWINS
jgi:hypothetical protein